jgi:hypothetical protein
LGTFQIAHPHFPQIIVHIQAKPVENALPERLQGRILRQPVQYHGQVQYDHLKAAVNRIGDAVVPIKGRQSRLRHDHAIQGRNGVGAARLAAKQGENHCVGSELTGTAAGYVNAPADARSKSRCRVWVGRSFG